MADDTSITLHVRARWVLLQTLVLELVMVPLTLVGWLVTGSGLAAGVTVLIVVGYVWVALRRQGIEIGDSGIRALRKKYVLTLGWDDLIGVTDRTYFGPFRVSTIETRPGVLTRRDGWAVPDALEVKVRSAGHDRLVMIGTCVGDLRVGPFGEMLGRHRPDLIAALPTATP